MALDFPNSPTNGQVYTDAGSGEQWLYDAPTNSWTSKGLVNTSGGLVFKGSLDITAAPPTGLSPGWQYSSSTTGTPNAGFTGITGTVSKGDVVMYTGIGWTLQSHSVPDATAVVKGIDTRKWDRIGTTLAPATAGDAVDLDFPLGTPALPGLTPVGDPNTGIYSPGADQVAISTNGTQKLDIDTNGRLTLSDSEGIKLSAKKSNLYTLDGSLSYYATNNGVYLSGAGAGGYLQLQAAGTEASRAAIALYGSTSPTPDAIVFRTSDIEHMRLDPSGRLLVGTTTANAAGAKLQTSDGLTFPAAAVSSADPNTLDDYEEGAWTPTLPNGGTFSVTDAQYRKIGNAVFAWCFVRTSSVPNDANAYQIGGLPFSPSKSATGTVKSDRAFPGVTKAFLAYCDGVSPVLAFHAIPHNSGAGVNPPLTNAQAQGFTNDFDLRLEVTYLA